ncbi:hypothetical protein J6590_014866 [Homalodisca vitripennis]|nr:hypothetical protein J6590_014866 [Homalodisca vitripennis]
MSPRPTFRVASAAGSTRTTSAAWNPATAVTCAPTEPSRGRILKYTWLTNTCPKVSDYLLQFCKCGRKYKYREGLSRHRNVECGVEPRYSCHFIGVSTAVLQVRPEVQVSRRAESPLEQRVRRGAPLKLPLVPLQSQAQDAS